MAHPVLPDRWDSGGVGTHPDPRSHEDAGSHRYADPSTGDPLAHWHRNTAQRPFTDAIRRIFLRCP